MDYRFEVYTYQVELINETSRVHMKDRTYVGAESIIVTQLRSEAHGLPGFTFAFVVIDTSKGMSDNGCCAISGGGGWHPLVWTQARLSEHNSHYRLQSNCDDPRETIKMSLNEIK